MKNYFTCLPAAFMLLRLHMIMFPTQFNLMSLWRQFEFISDQSVNKNFMKAPGVSFYQEK